MRLPPFFRSDDLQFPLHGRQTRLVPPQTGRQRCGEMRNERKFQLPATASALLFAFILSTVAEEKPSPSLTALSSTTISGYVDVSAHWNFQCPAAYSADAPCWETVKPWSTN